MLSKTKFQEKLKAAAGTETELAEAQFKSDTKLQELIHNYQKAANDLSVYLENSPVKTDAMINGMKDINTEESDTEESELDEDSHEYTSDDDDFPEEPMPGFKQFQEKRQKNIENKVVRGRISSEAKKAKERSGILKNTLKFVKVIFK